MTIDAIIQKLKEGNKRFVSDVSESKLNHNKIRKTLVEEQNPEVIILSCSDSRVVAEFIFDANLGELFVVRVAGNIASQSSIESIEFSVSKFESKVIVVLGHQNCGAVTEAIKHTKEGKDLGHLLSFISPAIDSSSSVDEIVKKNTKLTSDKLYKSSETIKKAVDIGGLKIVSAFYNLDSGKVDFL